MSGGEKFDVIVVGGGPSGISTGYFLAKKGFDVVVLERGEDIGTKNMFGGRIYSHVFDNYFPGWRSEAPIERWVEREKFTVLCKEDSISITFNKESSSEHSSFTAFLSKFLKWMANYAESSGALILPGVKVDRILFDENGGVIGVEAGGDRLESDYVVIGEGVNTVLLEAMGLKSRPSPDDVAVGVKEVIKLSRNVINQRFGLEDGEGIAEFLIGSPVNKFYGGGFLYTMDEYVTIGAVVKLRHIYDAELNIMDLAELLRTHKYIYGLLREGTLVEYSAHLVGENVSKLYSGKPYGDGYLIVGDAAGTLINTGFTIRGVDYAVESGRLASIAIEKSHSDGDRSEKHLSYYKRLLDASIIGRSVKKFSRVSSLLSNPRIHHQYVDLTCELFSQIYSVGEESPSLREAFNMAKRGRVGLLRMLLDLINVWRSL